MFYPAFLSLMNQLTESNKAHIVMDDKIVFIERLKDDEWVFSTKIALAEEETLSCFSSSGAFRFQQGNISLQLDSLTASICAVQKIQMPSKKYIPFKQHLTHFLEVVSQYEEMFTFKKHYFL